LQKKLKPAQRKKWFAKHRTMLKNGRSHKVVEAVKELSSITPHLIQTPFP
jgi:hypothetical protein